MPNMDKDATAAGAEIVVETARSARWAIADRLGGARSTVELSVERDRSTRVTHAL